MAHTFDVEVRWKEGFRGAAAAEGASHEVPFAVPKEFGGPGGEWTPEHLFTAGINTCVMATFLSIAQMSKLSFASYESRATCTMDKVEGALRILKVEVSPRIVVGAEKDRDRALRMIEKAEKLCPISNSVKCEIALHPTVEVAS